MLAFTVKAMGAKISYKLRHKRSNEFRTTVIDTWQIGYHLEDLYTNVNIINRPKLRSYFCSALMKFNGLNQQSNKRAAKS